MRWVRGRRNRQQDRHDIAGVDVLDAASMAPEALDATIARAEQLLEPAVELDAETRVEVLRSLGSCLRVRYERCDDTRDLERARETLKAALDAAPPGSEVRTRCVASVGVLGTSLLMRYDQSGRVAELVAGVELLTAAAEGAEPQSVAAAAQANDLANALVQRWRRVQNEGDIVAGVLADEDLRRAVELLKGALPAARTEAELRTAVLGSLVQALETRARRGADLAMTDEALTDVGEAISYGEEAVDATPKRSLARVIALTDVAHALLLRHRLAGDPDTLDDAISRLQAARGLGDSLNSPVAPVLSALANALATRIDTPRADEHDFDAISSCFRSALTESAGPDPRGALAAGLAWADWAMRRAAWPQATEAYDAALPLVERLLAGQLAHEDRIVTLMQARELARHAAYAAAMACDLPGAVLRLEQGRGFLIEQELAMEVRETPVFADVVAAAEGRTLVYLIPTGVGGMGLVVDPDGGIRMLLLPYLSADLLEEHIGPYWASHRAAAAGPDQGVIVVGSQGIEDSDPRRRAIDVLCEWMWQGAMRQVVAAVHPATAVTIIATGGLAVVPLHAAWHPDSSAPSGRRYAGDDLAISYAPRAKMLARDAALTDPGRMLAVVAPASAQLDPLPGWSIEVEAAAAIAAGVDVLDDAHATRTAVLDAMAGQRFLLFSTHGFADPDNPLRGGLVLADDEVLTVADVMRERLDGVRLAVLAACETGWSDTQLPDESLGLPAAFLAAGATGVIGSLWRVPTVATAMLIAKFYEELAVPPQDPAAALRLAQRWLRDTTNAEQREKFPDLLGPEIDPANQKLWEMAHGHASPYFWAGFVFVGR